ncbi:MAG: Na(+)-translocating NADH-quinone reductase subunit A [Pseudomonadota bacterium]
MLIAKGLDIPIAGEPEQVMSDCGDVSTVALLGADHIGLRPLMHVEEGDEVKIGQALFAERKHPEILHTSPGSGIVRQINRGARRALLSVVVELAGNRGEKFTAWPAERLADLRPDQVTEALLASGLWTAFRTRPFSMAPDPETTPSSIFVTAIDTDPLAAKAEIVIDAYRQDFVDGLTVLSRLTEGQVFVCQAPGADLPRCAADNVATAAFAGPHPAGLVGTHIHFLDPVSASKIVWHVGYQDVIAIGKLFTTGRLWAERIVALAGPAVKRPRLIRVPLGASTGDLTRGETTQPNCRVISGSVLSGRHAQGPLAYLGRYHNQVSVIVEGGAARPSKRFMPRRNRAFSAYGLTVTRRQKNSRYDLTSALNGKPTGMVPLGGFERVMPLDILPTQLLRALLVGDTDTAQALGCLELSEEDLALCAFMCPGKHDYGSLLRACLERIKKEG